MPAWTAPHRDTGARVEVRAGDVGDGRDELVVDLHTAEEGALVAGVPLHISGLQAEQGQGEPRGVERPGKLETPSGAASQPRAARPAAPGAAGQCTYLWLPKKVQPHLTPQNQEATLFGKRALEDVMK